MTVERLRRQWETTEAAGEAVPHVAERLSTIEERLTWADGLLLCLDFDGTLAPIVDDPDDAALHASVREELATLRDHRAVTLAVVSGRALDDVRARVGLDGVRYVGNHGLETMRDGARVVEPAATASVSAIERVVERLRTDLADVPGCTVEDKGVTATVHLRRAPRSRTDEVEAHVRSVVEDEPVQLTTGKAVLELRPPVDWDKGRAVRSLGEEHPDSLPVYVGDDTTDEAAFRALDSGGVGVHVGDGCDTAAATHVADPDGVAALLAWLADVGTDRLERAPTTRR